MDLHELTHQDANENFNGLNSRLELIASALSGNMRFALSQTTAAPTTADLAAADVEYEIGIRLETTGGVLHDWYNGKVLIAIADDDSTGVASITPAAGEVAMAGGELTVTVKMAKATWTAGKKATLTVSDLATAATGMFGIVVADATFVATVASSS